MNIKEDKSRGMLIGLVVGDALGAPVEFGHTAKSIRESWTFEEYQGGYLPKGVWTDDTSMALCLADSLLECGGYDSYDVMNKYLDWRDRGYRCYYDKSFDIGLQTDRALTRFEQDEPIIKKDEPREWSAGNGGIMRLAPAIIATTNEPIKNSMELARITSRETHNSEEADASAEIFGAMLWLALHETDKNKIIDVARYSTGEVFDYILSRVNQAKDKNAENKLENLGGYAVDAIKIAVWGFLNFDNFKDGMIAVIYLGGDTDTNAAIYGQLAGAYYGFKAIPKQWLKDLYLGKEIKTIADKLLAMKSCSILITRFEEDEIAGQFSQPPKLKKT